MHMHASMHAHMHKHTQTTVELLLTVTFNERSPPIIGHLYPPSQNRMACVYRIIEDRLID